jgi:circadian clock protein KaiC
MVSCTSTCCAAEHVEHAEQQWADLPRSATVCLPPPADRVREGWESIAIGFDLGGVTFLDLSPSSPFFCEVQSYDILAPAQVEREPTTQQIVAQVEKLKPQRVFLEAVTQFPYPASDAFQLRNQARERT